MNAISIVSKAVPTRTTLPILGCILLSVQDGVFTLLANDLELGIQSAPIPSTCLENGQISLEAQIFSDIIKKLPDGEVNIKSDDSQMVTICSGKSEYKLIGLAEDEFPLLPEVDRQTGIALPSLQLKNMIRQTLFSVSIDETRPVMTGELFELKNKALHIVSVDGFRISLRKSRLLSSLEGLKIVIPGKSLNEISKILPTDPDITVTCYVTDKHILFALNTCTVVSRLLEGEFIHYENVLATDYTTMVYVNREALLDGIERASLITKDKKRNPVKLTIEEKMLTISSQTELGTSKEELAVEIDGLPIEIAFNPRYLIDVLRAIDEEKIMLQLTTPKSPCLIRSDENLNFIYLILPLRL